MEVQNINVVQEDPASYRKKRRRMATACVHCHARKIKCDARFSPPGHPCKNCVEANLICESHLDGRVKASSATAAGLPTQTSASNHGSTRVDSPSSSPSSRSIPIHTPPVTSSYGSTGLSNAPSSSHIPTMSAAYESPGHLSWQASHSSQGDIGRDATDFSSYNSANQYPGSASSNSHDLSHTMDPLSLEGHGTESRRTTRPEPSLDRFEAYIEDSLGFYAPAFKNGRQRTNTLPSLSPWEEEDPIRHDRDIPEGRSQPSGGHPRRPTLSLEVEMSTRTSLALERQVASVDSADMDYLRAKGAFNLPPRHVQEELIKAYFTEVHPTAPVLNKTEILNDFYQNKMTSRLLLFAIFTAGCRACRIPALLDGRGTVHTNGQRFYKATKALLDTGYEKCKLKRVQAQLLITWWWDKKDDGGRNMRFCAVDAINTAQSIGMHRWGHYPHQDSVLVGVWKRTWWACVNRDVAVGVAHGLPGMLSPDEFDIPPLDFSDFNEEPNVPPEQRSHPTSDEDVRFFMEQTRLNEAFRYIHREYFTRRRINLHMTGSIASREAAWKMAQSQIVTTPASRDAPGGSPSEKAPGLEGNPWQPDYYNDQGLLLCRQWLVQLPESMRYNVDDLHGHSFWPAFLHILYYTAIMVRFREQSISKPSSGRAAAEREYCQSRGIAAATMISKIIRNIRAHGQVLRFTGQITGSIFNCLIFFLIEGQSPNEDVRRDAQMKYSMCLNVLYDFSQLWVSASLIHRLFESLQAHMHVSGKRPATLLTISQSQQCPLPGLSISSDITDEYMKWLLMIDYHYDDTNVTNLRGLDTPTNQGSSTASGDGSQGLLESLNVDQWLNFFDLGDIELIPPGQMSGT